VTGRQRILNSVRGLPVDYPAAAPYMGNFAIKAAEMSLSACYMNSENMIKAQMAAWKIFQQDVIVVQSDNYYMAEAFSAPVAHDEDTMPRLLDTVIKNPEDIGKLKPVDPKKDGRMPVYIEAIAGIRAKVGDKAAVRGCGTGPFVFAGHLCGIERLLLWMAETDMKLADHSEALDRIFTLGLETLIGFATAQLEAGATIIQLADSLASLQVISPEMYRKYVFPYEREFFQRMKPVCAQHDAVALLHICGNNTQVFEDYVGTEADIIVIDHAASLAEAKRVIGDRAALIGNLNPSGTLLFGTPEEVGTEVRDCLDTALPGKYILGTGCEVSMRTPIENMHAVLQTARDYTARNYNVSRPE